MIGSGRAKRRRMAAVVLLAVTCGACRADLAVTVDLNRDGGGTLGVSVTADEELLSQAEEAGADPLGDLADAGADLGRGWRVRERTDDDGSRTVTLTSTFADPDEFATLTGELGDALASDEADLLEGMAAGLTDDLVSVTGVAALRPTAVVREYGLTPREAVRLLRRTDAFGYTVAATLPGEVTDARGGTVRGRTVVWDVEPGRRLVFSASGTRPGPPWLRGVLGAAAGGVLAAGVLWLLARRRRATGSPD